MAKTRKKITTATDIWAQAIADTPVDDSGPRWQEQEPSAIAVWAVLALALLANAGFTIIVVTFWNWVTG